MQFQYFKNANYVFGKPERMTDEECGSLFVRKGKTIDGFDCSDSVWKPSAEELAQLNAGEPVALRIIGAGHPPVSITVGLQEVLPGSTAYFDKLFAEIKKELIDKGLWKEDFDQDPPRRSM